MGGHIIVGVDEAGRGPLAGPVSAAAVILDPSNPIDGLADSKKLSVKRRERLYDEIIAKSLCYCIAVSSVEEIDGLNILRASLLAMERAVDGLKNLPGGDIKVLVDGNICPSVKYPCEAIVKGDQKVAEISAASILAKVWRDREMDRLCALYPGYGFSKHAGYGTKAHLDAIKALGVTDVHRRSFGPVKSML